MARPRPLRSPKGRRCLWRAARSLSRLAELIEGVPGKTKTKIFTAQALAASGEPNLQAVLARITAKRPPFAGFKLDRPVLMGIVNVTPNSFSDGGLYDSTETAIAHAAELANAGAAIVDIGGEFDAARLRCR